MANKLKGYIVSAVDQIHVELYGGGPSTAGEDFVIIRPPDEEYRRFLEAVYNEDAAEGSLTADDLCAAQLIKDYALRNGIYWVSTMDLQSLVKALRVVLRRYGMSRKERRVQWESSPPSAA